MELQADCYAGVWGHVASADGRAAQGKVELDPDDLEEGLRAASAIGDDTIQKRSTGRVMPDKFTHGSSAQRVEWFRRGFTSGDPNACNTFGRLSVDRSRPAWYDPDRMPRVPAIGRAIPRRDGRAKGHRPGALHRRPDAAGHAAWRHRAQPGRARHHSRHHLRARRPLGRDHGRHRRRHPRPQRRRADPRRSALPGRRARQSRRGADRSPRASRQAPARGSAPPGPLRDRAARAGLHDRRSAARSE